MEHEKPKMPGWLIGLLVVFVLLLCGGGVVGLLGFFGYTHLRQAQQEAEMRVLELKRANMEAERAALEAERARAAANEALQTKTAPPVGQSP